MTVEQVAINAKAILNAAARLEAKGYAFGDPRLTERVWSKALPNPETGCWEWRASATTSRGYGRVVPYRGAKQVQAHRLVYETLAGPIPDGLQLDHLCRVRHCVNPSHLEPVTQQENLLRGQTIVAANAVKTHCPKQHEYAGGNLILDGGTRKCRECLRVRAAKKRARIRAERDAA